MPTKSTTGILPGQAATPAALGHERARGSAAEEEHDGQAGVARETKCHEFLRPRYRDVGLRAQRANSDWNRAVRERGGLEAVQSILPAGAQDHGIGDFGKWPHDREALGARSAKMDQRQEQYLGRIPQRAKGLADRGALRQI